jgi:hypothetical protein
LGQLGDYSRPLTTLAEFNHSRAVEQIQLDKPEMDTLSQRIRDLHRFIETNSPTFEMNELMWLGDKLCKLILQRKVRTLFDIASGQSPKLLPFEMFVEDSVITSWPWEYVYDDTHNKFLSQEFHPISRGIFTVFPKPSFRPIKNKVRILLILGVLPGDKSTPENEVEFIKEVFKAQTANDSVELIVKHSMKPEDIEKEIGRNRYDIFHYFGHAKFNDSRQEGFLSLERPGAQAQELYATQLAGMLATKNFRLVFLNGCETGRTSESEDPARSSIAAALLDRGIPAVIATQFSIPDVTAHYLSSMTYNSLVTGQPLVEAMRNGRRALSYSERSKFTDWGIPVLYTTDSQLVIFPKPKGKRPQRWETNYAKALSSDNVLKGLEAGVAHSPSLTVERTALSKNKEKARMNVALVDFDAKLGFLANLVQRVNDAQDFYNLEVDYYPLPSGAIRMDLTDERDAISTPQLYLPAIEDYLNDAPSSLGVDKVCCLTKCWIAGIDDDNNDEPFKSYRLSALNQNEDVLAISVVNLMGYAEEAQTSYAKAILYICLSAIVASDKNLPELIHEETAGCLFDNCRRQSDIVVGLRKMKFDHDLCRGKIKDETQLKAIDALLALDIKM